MKILILNWRDVRNPDSGGAEILTHEVAKRWVKKGHKIIQFSSSFPNSKNEEIVDGVRIIRRGRPDARFLWKSVHFLAWRYYQKNFKGKIDLVIDEVHGLPFFTPLYVKESKIALVCEVADDIWIKMFGKLFGSIGRLAEIIYLKLLYRKVLFVTISNSTKNDLMKNGVNLSHVKVLPMGITLPKNIKVGKKEKKPTLIFVGRLAKTKGIEDMLQALYKLRKINKSFKLWVVGRGNGNYLDSIKKLVRRLKLEGSVHFFGFVNDSEKFNLMSRAHILVSPSIKEGFGLTIPEAGSVGTPAVVYNSPGLSEVVADFKNGLVCKNNTSGELANNIEKLFKDKSLYSKLSKDALIRSKNYNWQKTADYFMAIIENETL